MRCRDCRYFEADMDQVNGPWKGSGHCTRWYQQYGEDPKQMNSNDCWVESDEGWANQVGPDFGCVLFEKSQTTR